MHNLDDEIIHDLLNDGLYKKEILMIQRRIRMRLIKEKKKQQSNKSEQSKREEFNLRLISLQKKLNK